MDKRLLMLHGAERGHSVAMEVTPAAALLRVCNFEIVPQDDAVWHSSHSIAANRHSSHQTAQ